jgi:hypothetical protein
MRGQLRTDQRVVVGRQLRVKTFTQPPDQGRGALDVGQQNTRKLPKGPGTRNYPAKRLMCSDPDHLGAVAHIAGTVRQLPNRYSCLGYE